MPHKDLEERKKYHKEYYKKHKKKLDEYRKIYRSGNKETERLWQDNYREKSIEARKWYAIKYRYGLSQEDYQKMFEEQDGCCLMCSNPFEQGKTPHIDHCHDTGKVRGLLCSFCNTSLGVFEKMRHLCEKYLERFDKNAGTKD